MPPTTTRARRGPGAVGGTSRTNGPGWPGWPPASPGPSPSTAPAPARAPRRAGRRPPCPRAPGRRWPRPGRSRAPGDQQRLVTGQREVAGRPGDGEHAQVRVADQEGQAGADLRHETAPLRRAAGAGAGTGAAGTGEASLAGADAAQARDRDREAHRVERQAAHRAERGGDRAGQPRAGDLRGALAAVQRRVGLRLLLRPHQGRQVHLVGGLEEHRGQPDDRRHDHQVGQGQGSGPRGERHGGDGDQRDGVGGQHHGAARQPVHPRPGRQAGHQPGQPRQGGQRGDGERGRLQGDHRGQRQRRAGDAGAHRAGRLARPQQAEVALGEDPRTSGENRPSGEGCSPGEAPAPGPGSRRGGHAVGEDRHRVAPLPVVGHPARHPPVQHADHLAGRAPPARRGSGAATCRRRTPRPSSARAARPGPARWRTTRAPGRRGGPGSATAPPGRRPRRPGRPGSRPRSSAATARPAPTTARGGRGRARGPRRPARRGPGP